MYIFILFAILFLCFQIMKTGAYGVVKSKPKIIVTKEEEDKIISLIKNGVLPKSARYQDYLRLKNAGLISQPKVLRIQYSALTIIEKLIPYATASGCVLVCVANNDEEMAFAECIGIQYESLKIINILEMSQSLFISLNRMSIVFPYKTYASGLKTCRIESKFWNDGVHYTLSSKEDKFCLMIPMYNLEPNKMVTYVQGKAKIVHSVVSGKEFYVYSKELKNILFKKHMIIFEFSNNNQKKLINFSILNKKNINIINNYHKNQYNITLITNNCKFNNLVNNLYKELVNNKLINYSWLLNNKIIQDISMEDLLNVKMLSNYDIDDVYKIIFKKYFGVEINKHNIVFSKPLYQDDFKLDIFLNSRNYKVSFIKKGVNQIRFVVGGVQYSGFNLCCKDIVEKQNNEINVLF